MTGKFKFIRRGLDALYFACGVLAALFLIAILVLITLQMMARWTGEVFPGAPDYAGYCMAASSFFAFAYALNHGSHIRVSLFLNALGRFRKWGEIWCFAVASAMAAYIAYYGIKAVQVSLKFNDISQGQDATPLWIPQMAMAIGATVLAIALFDHLVQLLVTGKHNIVSENVESHAE